MQIRDLNKKLDGNIQFIILIVLSVMHLFFTIYLNIGIPIIFSIEAALVALLIIGAVWLLFKDKLYLSSYLLLFLLVYGNAPFSFIRWLFSFDVSTGFASPFQLSDLLYTLAGIYLLLMIISYMLEEGFKVNKEKFHLDKTIILFAVLTFLTNTLNGFLITALILFIAINVSRQAFLLLIISRSLTMPIMFINLLTNSALRTFVLNVWLLAALSIVVIVFAVIDFMASQQQIKEPPEEVQIEELA